MSATTRSGSGGMVERRIVEVVVGEDDRASRDGAAEHPGPDRRAGSSGPTRGCARLMPASCAKRRCPVAGSSEVDHRAVRLEQARGLLDRRDQLVVEPPSPPSGSRAAARDAARDGRRVRAGRGLGGVVPRPSVGASDRASRAAARASARACACAVSGGHGPRIRRAPRTAGIAVRPMAVYVIRPRRVTRRAVERRWGRASRSMSASLAGRRGGRGVDDASDTGTSAGDDHHDEVPTRCSLPEPPLRPSDVVIRAAIVGLALATGYIHLTLGGLLFTLNAIGYVVAAVAMVVPLALAVRFRWFVRLGLMGYAATTIIGWAIQGPYFPTAYIAKAIEVALIVAGRHRLRPPRRQPDRGRQPRARQRRRVRPHRRGTAGAGA